MVFYSYGLVFIIAFSGMCYGLCITAVNGTIPNSLKVQ